MKDSDFKLLDAAISHALSEHDVDKIMMRVSRCNSHFMKGAKIDRLKPVEFALAEMQLERDKADYKRDVSKACVGELKSQLDS